jgi:pilus assembly protein CpaB
MALRKSLFPLLIALVLGLGAALFARNWMQSRLEAVEADKRNGTGVVVAATEIPFGTKILATHVKMVYWPKDNVPQGIVSDPALVIGKVANQKILPDEPVLAGRAINMGGGSSLAALIEPGMRAVTVRVNDVIGVAGFLLPGNRVDVLATREENKRARTRTLLQDLKVLAVDQTAAADKDKPSVVRAVTLEMLPQEAEQLVAATEEGSVQLALRNPEDVALLTSRELVEAPKPRQQRTPRLIAAEPAPPPPSITVIRQTQVGESRN